MTRRLDGYEAIFFDFDGVLVESIAIKVNAFKNLYNEFGDDVVARVVAHHKEHEGISRLEQFRYCHREFLDIELSDEEVRQWGERYTAEVEKAVVECDAVPGSLELLSRFKGRLPMFVVSGTPEDELRRIVDGRSMDGYFTEVRGSPLRKEPIVRELLAKNGLSADKSLFVGDAMTDYRAAEETGLDFLGRVPSGAVNPFPAGTSTVPDLQPLLQ